MRGRVGPRALCDEERAELSACERARGLERRGEGGVCGVVTGLVSTWGTSERGRGKSVQKKKGCGKEEGTHSTVDPEGVSCIVWISSRWGRE